jgi:hypothetical protein
MLTQQMSRLTSAAVCAAAIDVLCNAIIVVRCLQSADEGLVSNELFKRHAGADFEHWIKQGLPALGLGLSQAALEMARTDTTWAANAAAAAALAGGGGVARAAAAAGGESA